MKDNIKCKLRLMSQFYFLQKMQNQNFMQKMQKPAKISRKKFFEKHNLKK